MDLLMRRTVLALALAAGCVPDLDSDTSRVSAPRVLAARRRVRFSSLPTLSDAGVLSREQLAGLVKLVDAGELRVDIAARVPLADLPAVHADAAAGKLPSGKTIVLAA